MNFSKKAVVFLSAIFLVPQISFSESQDEFVQRAERLQENVAKRKELSRAEYRELIGIALKTGSPASLEVCIGKAREIPGAGAALHRVYERYEETMWKQESGPGLFGSYIKLARDLQEDEIFKDLERDIFKFHARTPGDDNPGRQDVSFNPSEADARNFLNWLAERKGVEGLKRLYDSAVATNRMDIVSLIVGGYEPAKADLLEAAKLLIYINNDMAARGKSVWIKAQIKQYAPWLQGEVFVPLLGLDGIFETTALLRPYEVEPKNTAGKPPGKPYVPKRPQPRPLGGRPPDEELNAAQREFWNYIEQFKQLPENPSETVLGIVNAKGVAPEFHYLETSNVSVIGNVQGLEAHREKFVARYSWVKPLMEKYSIEVPVSAQRFSGTAKEIGKKYGSLWEATSRATNTPENEKTFVTNYLEALMVVDYVFACGTEQDKKDGMDILNGVFGSYFRHPFVKSLAQSLVIPAGRDIGWAIMADFPKRVWEGANIYSAFRENESPEFVDFFKWMLRTPGIREMKNENRRGAYWIEIYKAQFQAGLYSYSIYSFHCQDTVRPKDAPDLVLIGALMKRLFPADHKERMKRYMTLLDAAYPKAQEAPKDPSLPNETGLAGRTPRNFLLEALSNEAGRTAAAPNGAQRLVVDRAEVFEGHNISKAFASDGGTIVVASYNSDATPIEQAGLESNGEKSRAATSAVWLIKSGQKPQQISSAGVHATVPYISADGAMVTYIGQTIGSKGVSSAKELYLYSTETGTTKKVPIKPQGKLIPFFYSYDIVVVFAEDEEDPEQTELVAFKLKDEK